MRNRLVTIATFAAAVDAQLAHQRLEAEGIPAVLRSEADAHMLQVPEEMSRAASDLLRRLSDEALPPAGEPRPPAGEPRRPASALEQNEAELERCLVCQSSLVSAKQPPLPLRALRTIFLQVVPLPPDWLQSRGRVCGVCKHEWKAE